VSGPGLPLFNWYLVVVFRVDPAINELIITTIMLTVYLSFQIPRVLPLNHADDMN
jgi:hypothetical protein